MPCNILETGGTATLICNLCAEWSFVVTFHLWPFRPGRTRCWYHLDKGWMSPVTDVRALEERNVWEIESLFHVNLFVTRESLL